MPSNQERNLHFTLFGSTSIRYGDAAFMVERLQNRALLYRLAAQTEPVARDHLCFLFWPDEGDARSRRLLTQVLSHVRRALPESELLIATAEHIQLDPARVSSDVAIFNRLCRSVTAAQVEDLLQAVELYKGSFLAGVTVPDHPEYDTWLSAERTRLEQLYLDALNVLLDYFMEQGQPRRAVEMAQRYLATDEVAEEVHRRLMHAYAAAGERSAALQQYEQCVRVLEQELGVSPLPETKALYQAIRTGANVAAAMPASMPIEIPSVWATLPGPDVPLVGRGEILGALTKAFQQSLAGQGQVVFLTGEAGIGKSRVMQEFASIIKDKVVTLLGSCHPSTQSVPYQPVVEALRPALVQIESSQRIALSWLQTAALLFPEITAERTAIAMQEPATEPLLATGTPEQFRSQLFEALRLMTMALASPDRPLLFCLDDLHWADTTTLDWLCYLARQIRNSSLLVVATYRSEEADAVGELRRALGRLQVRTEVQLPPLDAGQVHQLLLSMHLEWKNGDAEQIAQRLQPVTAGNPFFVLETMQALLEVDILHKAAAHNGEFPISENVRETVQSRLDHLQPTARQMLEAASVWGWAFALEGVRQTAGRSETEALDAFEELLSRHILREANDGFTFRHEITRSVVYQGISPWRRRLLHRRTAEALEASLSMTVESQRGALVAQIGQHYVEAGESKRAVEYLLQAGDYARMLFELHAALGHYQRAMTFLRQQDDVGRCARTLMKMGLLYHNTMAYEQARVTFDEAFVLYRKQRSTQSDATLAPAPHPLRIMHHFNPSSTVDPAMYNSIPSTAMCQQLFSGLVRISAELDVVPDVAERWEILEHGKEYRFYLRNDVRWSDGTRVTAHDFEFAWKRVLAPETHAPMVTTLFDLKGAKAYHEGSVKDPSQVGVRALDDLTLAVELEEPLSSFLYLLSVSTFFPVPRHVIEKVGAAWTTPEKMVNNGPFLLEKWDLNEVVIFMRNPNFHGYYEGNVQKVICIPAENWSAKRDLYRADELDILWLYFPPSAEVQQARQQWTDDYVTLPFMATEALIFNVNTPPFDDARVRQALSMAIDKETLAYKVMQGYTFPANGGFLPPGMMAHSDRPILPYDPAHARQLLAKAGYPAGEGFPPVDWLVATGSQPDQKPVAEFLHNQWQEKLGLTLSFQLVDWGTLVERYIAGRVPPIVIETVVADYPDPDSFFRNGVIQFLAKWQDEVFEWLAIDARLTFDHAERVKLYQQMDRMAVEEAVLVPLSYTRWHLLSKPWVKSFPTSPISFWHWKDVVIELH